MDFLLLHMVLGRLFNYDSAEDQEDGGHGGGPRALGRAALPRDAAPGGEERASHASARKERRRGCGWLKAAWTPKRGRCCFFQWDSFSLLETKMKVTIVAVP